jgi:endonuclease YncB( thermonuclease family)
MPRAAAKVSQADIARAMRVAKAEGMTVEVRPDGTIRIVPVDTPQGKVDTSMKWVP